MAGGGQTAHGSISQSIGELACCRVGVSAAAMHCLVACRASVRPSKCLSVPSIDSRNGGRRLAAGRMYRSIAAGAGARQQMRVASC